jgi:predicted DNA-binding transcriptional regulator AlpA
VHTVNSSLADTFTFPAGLCDFAEAGHIAGSLSESTLRRLLKDPQSDFPKPVRITRGRIGFVRAEVVAWCEGRVAADRAARRPPSEVHESA